MSTTPAAPGPMLLMFTANAVSRSGSTRSGIVWARRRASADGARLARRMQVEMIRSMRGTVEAYEIDQVCRTGTTWNHYIYVRMRRGTTASPQIQESQLFAGKRRQNRLFRTLDVRQDGFCIDDLDPVARVHIRQVRFVIDFPRHRAALARRHGNRAGILVDRFHGDRLDGLPGGGGAGERSRPPRDGGVGLRVEGRRVARLSYPVHRRLVIRHLDAVADLQLIEPLELRSGINRILGAVFALEGDEPRRRVDLNDVGGGSDRLAGFHDGLLGARQRSGADEQAGAQNDPVIAHTHS